MKRFFIVGFSVLSLIVSGFSFADEKFDTGLGSGTAPTQSKPEVVKQEAVPPAVVKQAEKVVETLPTPPTIVKPELETPALGTSHILEGKKLALAVLDAEEAMQALINRDSTGLLTFEGFQAMQKSNDAIVRNLVETFIAVNTKKTPAVQYNVQTNQNQGQNPNVQPRNQQQQQANQQQIDGIQKLYNSGELRNRLLEVMQVSRKNFEALEKGQNRQLLNYSLRNRLALTTHFLKGARHMISTSRNDAQVKQDFYKHIQAVESKLTSVVDSLEGYSKACIKDGVVIGDYHADWFEIARSSINDTASSLGQYEYSDREAKYSPTGDGAVITIMTATKK